MTGLQRDYPKESAAAIAQATAAERLIGEAAEEGRKLAIRALLSIPIGVQAEERADALLSLAKTIYFKRDRLLTAVEPAALGVAMGVQVNGDTEKNCRAYMLQGTVLNSCMNVHDGVACFQSAMDMAERLGSGVLKAMSAINIGNSFYELARYDTAIFWYRTALNFADHARSSDRQQAQQHAGRAMANMARCYYHKRDYEEGIAAIETAMEMIGSPVDTYSRLHRSLGESLYASLLVARGRKENVIDHAERALALAKTIGNPQSEVEAEGARGLCEVVLGNADVGRTRVLNALERSKVLPDAYRNMLFTAALALEKSGDAMGALACQREFAMNTRKAYVAAELQQRVTSIVMTAGLADDIDGFLGEQDEHFKRELQRQLSSMSRLATLAVQAEATVDEDVFHPWRVQKLMKLLGMRLGISEEEIEAVSLGGLLHDIGMICVPRSTQLKAEKLDAEEVAFVKAHPAEGAKLIMAAQGVPHLLIVEEVITHHHERWDGNGYSYGLRGRAIPVGARMCALCDSWDVMTHDRPYARARSIEDSLLEIERSLGRQFDPDIGRVFIEMLRELTGGGGNLDALLTADVASDPLAKAAVQARNARLALLH